MRRINDIKSRGEMWLPSLLFSLYEVSLSLSLSHFLMVAPAPTHPVPQLKHQPADSRGEKGVQEPARPIQRPGVRRRSADEQKVEARSNNWSISESLVIRTAP